MASGLPVVVSRTAGCAENLLEADLNPVSAPAEANFRTAKLNAEPWRRQNGFLFDPASAPELGRILLVLEFSPAMRTAMGRASRQIIEKFSCRAFAVRALRAASAALGR